MVKINFKMLTTFVNTVFILSLVFNVQSLVIPLLYHMYAGILVVGTLITHFFPREIMEAYNIPSRTFLIVSDIIMHWLMYYWSRNWKPSKYSIIIAIVLPILLYPDKKSFTENYPGVPSWVIMVYIFAIILSLYKII